MPAIPLILGETQRNDLSILRQRAALDPVDVLAVIEMLKTPAGKDELLMHMAALTIPIPTGFMVTFSIETGHPAGTCRHMSMSTPRRRRVPTPDAVWMVCAELGFVGGLGACKVWVEELSDDEMAVNVAQPLTVVAG
jgi:hypothetical protein